MDVNGWSVGGMPDLFTEDLIQDWKTTSVWTILFDSHKDEYVKQLNIYRLLAAHHGFKDIKKLQNVMILRDWHKSMALRNPEMPRHGIEIVDQEVVPYDEVENWVVQRVRLFQHYENIPDDGLPPCTDSERWKKEDVFAVRKEGRKSAIKLCAEKGEADKLLTEKYKGADSIEFRPGIDVKCKDYCQVCKFCDYYKSKYEGTEND